MQVLNFEKNEQCTCILCTYEESSDPNNFAHACLALFSDNRRLLSLFFSFEYVLLFTVGSFTPRAISLHAYICQRFRRVASRLL